MHLKQQICTGDKGVTNPQESPNMFSGDERSGGGRTFLQRKARKDGSKFTESEGFPHYSIVIICLGLLSTVLLIIAIVIGVYCGKFNAEYVPPHQNTIKLINKLKEFQENHNEMVKAEDEAQRALARELAKRQEMRLQIEEQKSLSDVFQSQIESLREERRNLRIKKSDAQGNCGLCQSGWVFLNSSCYFYANSESFPKKNWYHSRADCISRGGDLVVIDNWEEQELLFDFLPKVGSSSKAWWAMERGIWIGLTDLQTEGTWVWVNNVTQQSEGYWIPGEPNNHGTEGEDCVEIFNRGNPRKTWFDGKCQTHYSEWLCEMKPRLS